ncbi:MAG: gliding motility protein GldB [Dysgonamonadaceae bacterium]|jgi:hypothetical protein|nr:gliding motility protein GldB [Dysgonamonadaceae bacterium]
MNKLIQNNIRFCCLILFSVLTFSCSGNKTPNADDSAFKIIRFDNELYRYLNDKKNNSFLSEHFLFLNEYGEKIIHTGRPDSLGFETRLNNFFSEPTLMSLYKDEQEKFADITEINIELSQSLALFFDHFPEIKKPQVYMHVSGLQQNVIVTDDILSLSVDKYMGMDYPLYQKFFYDYQRRLMTPERIVPDYLLGFMMANFPFQGNNDILLDRMIYEGKLRYILSRLLSKRNYWEYVGYNPEQYEWCRENGSRIWKYILENQHLFTPDYKTTIQYLREAPYTSLLPSESPGQVGVWMGFQIVASYMKHFPDTSLNHLMTLTDYQDFLKKSKYKP